MKLFLKILLGIILFPFISIVALLLGIVCGFAAFIWTIYEIFYSIYSTIFNVEKKEESNITNCPDYIED